MRDAHCQQIAHMVVIEGVEDDAPLPARAHQATLAQGAQLMGDGAAVDAGGGGEIADAELAGGKRGQKAESRRIGQARLRRSTAQPP